MAGRTKLEEAKPMKPKTRQLIDTITYEAQAGGTVVIELWHETSGLFNVITRHNGKATGRSFHTEAQANTHITNTQRA